MSFSTGKNKILNTPENPAAQELYRTNTKKGKKKTKQKPNEKPQHNWDKA